MVVKSVYLLKIAIYKKWTKKWSSNTSRFKPVFQNLNSIRLEQLSYCVQNAQSYGFRTFFL